MRNEKRIGRKRLSVDLPLYIHNQLKIMAVKQHCSVTALIIRTLVKKLSVEAIREGQIEI